MAYSILTVDLSHFFREGDKDGKKKAMEYSDEEKLKSSPGSGAPLPVGYNKQPAYSPNKNEYMLMFPPSTSFNVYPKNPPEFKCV
ncbi:hypothetical protein JRO89_XS13G0170100 [Xanthoceras sorbifolium]|uniref:Uncharacterized protein n=1 Tax=Xanthoceras sorbifolium TaxID=99658 RepID=A0ABQ8H8S0_9ROSI|nr:hypothetical protein JRO89_XS13G0170100 [Xanthoceras sorbifolium]